MADAAGMEDHHRRLGRGFNWLGGATVIAKIVDFVTILTMLMLLTKQQVGIASLVVSIGMVVEAFNGLGTGEAVLQAPSVSRLQLDSVFWYVVGASAIVGTLTLAAAPVIQAIYGYGGLALYFIAVVIKQPLVGAAVVPLAIMNRELRYERIAVVNVCATFGAAAVRLALGWSGAGTWALVAGYTASGLFILVGAMVAQPFRPGLRFDYTAIRPLTRFGARAAMANASEQLFKNVDYLLIGWFYGPSQLAMYRVAFDVAMEPAMAVGTLVNRTALPVLARVSAVKQQLAATVTWSLQRVAILVMPLMVGLMLVAGPLMSLIHDKQGNSYAGAAWPLRLLAAAAVLRVMAQLLSSVMMASGRPGHAARLAGTTLLLLGGGILAVGLTLRAQAGIIAVSAIWLAIYPLLMVWGARYLWQNWDIPAAALARTLGPPLVGVLALTAIVESIRPLIGADPRQQLALVVAAMAVTYAGLFWRGRKVGALPRTPPGTKSLDPVHEVK